MTEADHAEWESAVQAFTAAMFERFNCATTVVCIDVDTHVSHVAHTLDLTLTTLAIHQAQAHVAGAYRKLDS